MENLSHTLSGLVLARLGIDRDGGWATALVVSAANFPDVDGLSLFWGQGPYLSSHHGITHSIFGVLVAGPILGGLFTALARWRGASASLWRFVLYAYAGLVMHCSLDWLLSYGMRPWLPFRDDWYYGDAIHVADPWMWVLLGSGAMLGGPKGGAGRWWWAATAALTVGLAATAAQFGRAPWLVVPVLAVAWIIVVGLRFRGFALGHRRGMAVSALCGAAGYVALLVGLGNRNAELGMTALRAATGVAKDEIQATSILPAACVPWQSTLVVQTETTLYRVRVAGTSASARVDGTLPRLLDQVTSVPEAGAEALAVWRDFARHPFLGRLDGDWILGDGRYSFGVREDWCNLRVSGDGR